MMDPGQATYDVPRNAWNDSREGTATAADDVIRSASNHGPREQPQPNRHERRKNRAVMRKLGRQVKATLKR